MRHPFDLRTLKDLADGEMATPEPGSKYALRADDNWNLDVGTKLDVVRRGDPVNARLAQVSGLLEALFPN